MIQLATPNITRHALREPFERGYFGMGIFHAKTEYNIGTLWRSAMNFGAAFIFTIGRRYSNQSSDTAKTGRHIPLYHFQDLESFLEYGRPKDCQIIGVEQLPGTSVDLPRFVHPERAIYLLGAEDHGLTPTAVAACNALVEIDTPICLNVATAGSIVMYDRAAKLKAR